MYQSYLSLADIALKALRGRETTVTFKQHYEVIRDLPQHNHWAFLMVFERVDTILRLYYYMDESGKQYFQESGFYQGTVEELEAIEETLDRVGIGK